MGDDPDRSTSHNATHRSLAWHHMELHPMGRMAWTRSLPSKPLERFCKDANQCNQPASTIGVAGWRGAADISLRRIGMGLLCTERTVTFSDGVCEIIEFLIKTYHIITNIKLGKVCVIFVKGFK